MIYKMKNILSQSKIAGQKLIGDFSGIHAKSSKYGENKILSIDEKGPSRETTPSISVVVPCFNVAKYVSETLDSILRQRNISVEIILVNDGSSDTTLEILRAYEDKYSNIFVHDQDNAGLGAARNSGIRLASAKYITFIDSDDTIPPNALSTMVSSLENTGSDFAIGTMERRQGSRRWVPDWAKAVHSETKQGVQLEDDLDILKDVFACNKVFRKDFFDEIIGYFPEGIRYEDQEPTAKAYVASKAFDVLSDIVYTWVIREDGSSITQQKSNINDLIDRLKVLDRVSAVLVNHNNPSVYKSWLLKSLGFDFKPYYDQILRTETEYWETLVAGLAPYFAKLTSEEWRLIPFWDRMNALSVARGSIADIAEIATSRQELGSGYEITNVDSVLTLNADFVDSLSFVPAFEDLVIDPSIISPKVELRDLVWSASNELILTGAAWIPGLGTNRNQYTVDMFVAPQGKLLSKQLILSEDDLIDFVEDSLPVNVSRITIDDPDLGVGDAYNSYDNSGFTIKLDFLESHFFESAGEADRTWQLFTVIKIDNNLFYSPFTSVHTLGRASNLELGNLIGEKRFSPKFTDDLGLVINQPTLKPTLQDIKVHDGTLEFKIDSTGFDGASQIILRSKNRPDLILDPYSRGSNLLQFRFDTSMLLNASHQETLYELRLKHRHSSSLIQFQNGTKEANMVADFSKRLRMDLSPNGFVRLRTRGFGVMATLVDIDSEKETLCIIGQFDCAGIDELRFHLVSDKTRLEPVEYWAERNTGEFKLLFDLSIDADEIMHPGAYSLRANLVSGIVAGRREDYWVPVDLANHHEYPKHALLPNRLRIRVAKTKQAKALWINAYIPLNDIARSKKYFRQLTNDTELLAFANDRIRNATLFESFGGNSVSDSPKSLFEWARDNEAGGELIWAVKDGTFGAPEGATTVVINSPEYVQALHSSKTLINNNNFPFYFRKNENQFYLQTWHGTPLKKIGNDVPKTSLSISYRRLMEREVRYWDALLAQNDFAAEKFVQAFGFNGPVWVDGYPRNDSLIRPSAESTRRHTRRRLGITDDQLVILYAPTWRDNQKTSSNHYDLVTYLNFTKFSEVFGDTVTVLSRGHMNTLNSGRTISLENVVDVSRYSDVNDLILASDCLVGDYSSIMFDYVNTGKPVFVLAPDLEVYGGETRGFYFDFKSNAPGPITSSTDELIEMMKSGFYLSADQSAAYKREFAMFDDGKASERVGKKIWNSQGISK